MAWILLLALLFGIVAFLLWQTRPRVACPECKNKHVTETGREPIGANFYERGGGGNADTGGVSVQTVYKITYYCPNCDKPFTNTITQTR